MSGVEQEHGVDFSAGIPAAYGVLADLLNTVIEGVEPDFALVKLEGDAVFAAAPAATLDGHGEQVLEKLAAMYESFIASRTRAIPANDHVCTACPAVAHLDLKAVLHRGQSVRQMVGSGSDLLGPAVTVAHRLLKNTVREQIGSRAYVLMTDAAAGPLGLSDVGRGAPRGVRRHGPDRRADRRAGRPAARHSWTRVAIAARRERRPKRKTRWSPSGSFRAWRVEATTGFEPMNRGFADLRVEPLHHVARGAFADKRPMDAGCPLDSNLGSRIQSPLSYH